MSARLCSGVHAPSLAVDGKEEAVSGNWKAALGKENSTWRLDSQSASNALQVDLKKSIMRN